jgi:molecular chaperone GrpE
MAKANARKKAEAAVVDQTDGSASTAKAAGADQWTKAVVDGVPSEPDSVQPDEVLAEGAADDSLEELTLDDRGLARTNPDQEILDAEIIDAEIVDDDDQVEEADVAMDNNEDAETALADTVEERGSDGVAGANPGGQPEEVRPAVDISVEDLVLDLERVTTERDQYLDASRRLQAEFENYKKQVSKREAAARERANDSLIGELLPVLDAFDGAVANGAEDVVPMRTTFLDALAKQGLERIDPVDAAFDPNLHEAVMHDQADDTDGPVVAEVMRAGYVWKGRVLRPAMVRTRG